jgi:hypothetical protein
MVPTRDKEGRFIPTLKDGKEQRDGSGGLLIDTHPATFAEILRLFLNEIFRLAQMEAAQTRAGGTSAAKEMTIEDSACAIDIHRAAGVILDGRLELEKHPHEWLLKQIDVWGVKVLGVNAAVLKAPVVGATEEEPNRAERRREEKAEQKI